MGFFYYLSAMGFELNKILNEDCFFGLDDVPDCIAHTCVTSPPYYGLRDYGITPTVWPEIKYKLFGFEITIPAMSSCLGLEPSPEAYIGHVVAIFRKVRRVLRNDGTLWLNMGDSYAGYHGNKRNKENPSSDRRDYKENSRPSELKRNSGVERSTILGGKINQVNGLRAHETVGAGKDLKPKDMIGIPWMLAFALRSDGWYLRSDIIWHKPNPMPESVHDRPTKSHEYIFLLSKSQKYFYDKVAIMQDLAVSTQKDYRLLKENYQPPRVDRGFPDEHQNRSGLLIDQRQKFAWGRAIDGSIDDNRKGNGQRIAKTKSGNLLHKVGSERDCPADNHANVCSSVPWEGLRANKRTVWTVPTIPFDEAHYATFPEQLIIDCIKAGTSVHGCCVECGAPYKRVTEKKLVPGPQASYNTVSDSRDRSADENDQGSNRVKDGHMPGWVEDVKTLGWQRTCKCAAEEIKPCIVLDPFAGAGTTPLVAQSHGRNWIAFELKKENIEISNRRLIKNFGLFAI